MAALINAAKVPGYPAEIVGVFANRADAGGLAVAQGQGIPTAVLSHKDFATREAFDAGIDAILANWKIELVCLAGFLRLLTPGFTRRWEGRMINIHPSLLPAFKGLHTHELALAAGVAEHGCTVHFVSEGMDEGAVLAQAKVPVLAGDTPETLAARVLVAEHRLYPEALAALASGTGKFA